MENINIEFNITQEEANKLYARLVQARNGLRKAIDDNNIGNIGFFFGWLDADLTKVVQSLPDSIKIQAKKDIVNDKNPGEYYYSDGSPVLQFDQDGPQRGGGGRKPN